jgi:hypothetical protein
MQDFKSRVFEVNYAGFSRRLIAFGIICWMGFVLHIKIETALEGVQTPNDSKCLQNLPVFRCTWSLNE